MYNYIGDKMKLLNDLNIVPNNIKVYEQAFIHSSYKNEGHVTEDYERLEFLGDALVDLIVSDYLYNAKHLKEGQMTKLRASFVCENALYEYSKEINLKDYIKVGNGVKEPNKTVIADVFEAIIGAIYLEKGLSTVEYFFKTLIVPYIESDVDFLMDYKSTLQELVQTEKKSVEYALVKEGGPAHKKYFIVKVMIDGIVYGEGTGKSKKEAEQHAAKEAIKKRA